MKDRRGFTYIEMLIVFIVIGIIVNIMIPSLGLLRRRAEAVRVIGDVEAVENAILTRYVDYGDYPPSDVWGTIPEGLDSYLPTGFSFDYDLGTYRWWNSDAFVGIEARPFNIELVDHLLRYYRGRTFLGPSGDGSSVVFVIDG